VTPAAAAFVLGAAVSSVASPESSFDNAAFSGFRLISSLMYSSSVLNVQDGV